jgi:hypothetical protein
MRRLKAPSPALVISLIALFVALGGTSYAATHLPKNSVGTRQLKKNAVTGAKIEKHAITAAKIDPRGLTVPNAANAVALGTHGASYFAPATLQSGRSESGVWIASGSGSVGFDGQGVAFPTPLAGALDGGHVDQPASGTDSHCPGAGQAAQGYLCVYTSFSENVTVSIDNHSGTVGSDAYGFFVGLKVSATPGLAYGSWTVTAA